MPHMETIASLIVLVARAADKKNKYDQIVPPFYTQALADLIPTAKRAEIPSGHLSFLEKPADLASAMLTFLLEKHPSRLGAGEFPPRSGPQRGTPGRAKSHTVEVSGASHAVYVSRPKEVAALIEEAATHTRPKTL